MYTHFIPCSCLAVLLSVAFFFLPFWLPLILSPWHLSCPFPFPARFLSITSFHFLSSFLFDGSSYILSSCLGDYFSTLFSFLYATVSVFFSLLLSIFLLPLSHLLQLFMLYSTRFVFRQLLSLLSYVPFLLCLFRLIIVFAYSYLSCLYPVCYYLLLFFPFAFSLFSCASRMSLILLLWFALSGCLANSSFCILTFSSHFLFLTFSFSPLRIIPYFFTSCHYYFRSALVASLLPFLCCLISSCSLSPSLFRFLSLLSLSSFLLFSLFYLCFFLLLYLSCLFPSLFLISVLAPFYLILPCLSVLISLLLLTTPGLSFSLLFSFLLSLSDYCLSRLLCLPMSLLYLFVV